MTPGPGIGAYLGNAWRYQHAGGDVAVDCSILVPAPAISSPHGPQEQLLRPDVEVIDNLWFYCNVPISLVSVAEPWGTPEG